MENPQGRGGGAMRLSARRFPDTIVRRRELPGVRNSFGEWVAGQTMDEELRASVQPLALADAELEAGNQLVHRLKLFVLPRREKISTAVATLLYDGDPVSFRGDPLTLFAGFEVADRHALAAAFEAAGADRVIVEGAVYVVQESRTWKNFTRATLLRET